MCCAVEVLQERRCWWWRRWWNKKHFSHFHLAISTYYDCYRHHHHHHHRHNIYFIMTKHRWIQVNENVKEKKETKVPVFGIKRRKKHINKRKLQNFRKTKFATFKHKGMRLHFFCRKFTTKDFLPACQSLSQSISKHVLAFSGIPLLHHILVTLMLMLRYSFEICVSETQ